MIKFETETNKLVDQILGLFGNKIVTLCSEDEIEMFDISLSGEIGYNLVHKARFYRILNDIFNNNGAVMIRQFTEDYTKNNIPIKNIYGIRISNGKAIGLNSEQVEYVSRLQPDGTLSIKEEAVNYCTINC
ncbi:hypothetical protein [Paenibacillus naphthalenovorans]|uniref:hypothetical protein n=1 Tax=Paenibacillus naphthalenovorans TaxID=162209 RepID=UPI003D2CCE4A